MALPAHLAKYSGLIDLLVEELVREAAEGLEEAPQPGVTAGLGEIRERRFNREVSSDAKSTVSSRRAAT